MAYYLGIDGGGTKTRCVLATENAILARVITGGSNIVRLGEAQTREALQNGIYQVCATANVAPGRIRAVCIGAAGAARPEIAAKMRSILTELIPEIGPAGIEVIGDTEIALEAAFGSDPGVVTIAGTGSVAYGRSADGRTARAGGWGFAVSDEGSGHWIGRRAISAVLSAHDEGRETALAAGILQAWNLNSLDELVQQANSTPSPDFSRSFRVVLRTAEEGDTVASDLLAEGGAKLADLCTVVLRRLGRLVGDAQENRLPVAMTGSVFRQSSEVCRVFYNSLQVRFPGIEMRRDLTDPVEGALSRARRL